MPANELNGGEGRVGTVFDAKFGRYLGWLSVIVAFGVQVGSTTARLDALTEQVKEVKTLAQGMAKEMGDRQRLIGRFEVFEMRLERIERLLDANHRRSKP